MGCELKFCVYIVSNFISLLQAYFKVMDVETKGTIGARFRFNLHRFLDSQVSFIRGAP